MVTTIYFQRDKIGSSRLGYRSSRLPRFIMVYLRNTEGHSLFHDPTIKFLGKLVDYVNWSSEDRYLELSRQFYANILARYGKEKYRLLVREAFDRALERFLASGRGD